MVIREYPISEEEKREIRTIFQEKRAITGSSHLLGGVI
jgi:hypothetical protein